MEYPKEANLINLKRQLPKEQSDLGLLSLLAKTYLSQNIESLEYVIFLQLWMLKMVDLVQCFDSLTSDQAHQKEKTSIGKSFSCVAAL